VFVKFNNNFVPSFARAQFVCFVFMHLHVLAKTFNAVIYKAINDMHFIPVNVNCERDFKTVTGNASKTSKTKNIDIGIIFAGN
jgi:hypothetical protein